MKKNKISKNWIIRQKRDIYVKQSKIEGYRSRAVYKLVDINNKFKIFRNGIAVVDLGAAPGSWSQLIVKEIKNIKLVTVDLQDMEKVKNAYQIKGDFTSSSIKILIKEYFKEKIDLVLSDMAVNTTGNKNLDSTLTGDLCLNAMNFATEILKTDGIFVSKIFMGSSFKEIISISKKKFKKTNIFKPPASRKESKENFIICKHLR